jgi:hypothetical protein
VVFVQQPTNAVAGTAISPAITVQLQDQFSNNVSVAGDTIQITLTGGTGVLSGTASQLTNANGLATFGDLSINLAGPKNLTATRARLTSAVSTTFTISANSLNNFLIEAVGGGNISPQGVGVPFDVKITARDVYNNVVTSFTGSVNITSTGNLSSGGGPTQPFVAGILSSHTVTISNSGNFTITATKPSTLESGTSNSFAVNLVVVSAKVYLQGPWNGITMNTTLNSLGLIPLTQPYNTIPWNYNGAESVSLVPANVVDWVLVELRTDTSASTKIAARAAFLRNDGVIADTNGTSPVAFSGASFGNYYVIIRHRNHLPVMTALPISLNGASSLYDFTVAQDRAYGSNAIVTMTGGVWGMYAGDVDGNGVLKYSGASNDRGPIYVRIGGSAISATASGYFPEDTNMDGIVKYSGAGNDRAIIYQNIGGASVSATVKSPVP